MMAKSLVDSIFGVTHPDTERPTDVTYPSHESADGPVVGPNPAEQLAVTVAAPVRQLAATSWTGHNEIVTNTPRRIVMANLRRKSLQLTHCGSASGAGQRVFIASTQEQLAAATYGNGTGGALLVPGNLAGQWHLQLDTTEDVWAVLESGGSLPQVISIMEFFYEGPQAGGSAP